MPSSQVQIDFAANKAASLSFRQRIGSKMQLCCMFFKQQSLASALLILLLGMLLVLPAGLWVIDKNIQATSYRADYGPKIILYLDVKATEKQALELRDQIKQHPGVAEAIYISPAQGLKELVQHLGLSELFVKLPVNPLPTVIAVSPSVAITSSAEVQNLATALKVLPQVASLQMNLELIKRQYAYLNLWKKIFYIALGLSGLVILLANVMQTFVLQQIVSPPIAANSNHYCYYRGMALSLFSVMVAIVLIAMVFYCFAESWDVFFSRKIIGLDSSIICKLTGLAFLSSVGGVWIANRLKLAKQHS